MVRESQKKASRKYEREHATRNTYTTARRKAFNFLNAGSSSKVGQAIQKYKIEYIDDLKNLYNSTGEKIKELTGEKP